MVNRLEEESHTSIMGVALCPAEKNNRRFSAI
jgi:hypothetical protein